MKLFIFELKKLSKKNIVIVMTILIVCAVISRFYYIVGKQNYYDKEIYEVYKEELFGQEWAASRMCLEEKLEGYNTLYFESIAEKQGVGLAKKTASDELVSDQVRREFEVIPEDLISSHLLSISLILSQAEYVHGREQFVEDVIGKAREKMEISLFSKEASFSYRNIVKSINDYENVRDIEIYLFFDRGIDVFGKYKSHLEFFIMTMIVIMYGTAIMGNEKENGSLSFISTTAKGNLPLANSKLWILFVSSGLVSLLILILRLVVLLVIYGPIGVNYSLQSAQYFKYCTYHLSIGEFLFIDIFFKLLIVIFMDVLFLALYVLIGRARLCALILGIFSVISYLAYEYVDALSVFQLFKYVNVYSLFSVNEIMAGNVNVNLLGYPIGFFYINIPIIILFTVICILVYFFGFKALTSRSDQRVSVRFKGNKLKGHTSLLMYESYRLLVQGRGIVFIGLIIFAGYNIFEKAPLSLSNEDYYYYRYIETISSYENDKVSETIETIRTELENTWNDQIDQSGMESKTGYYYAFLALKQIDEQYARLLTLNNGNNLGKYKMINDIAAIRVINSRRTVFGFVYLIIMSVLFGSSIVYGVDYSTGMNDLLKTTVNGRGKLTAGRIINSTLFYSVCFAFMTIIMIYNWIEIYKMKYFNVAIQSISLFYQSEWHISFLTLIVIWLLTLYLFGLLLIQIPGIIVRVIKSSELIFVCSSVIVSAVWVFCYFIDTL